MTSKDPLVVFTPSGKRGRFPRRHASCCRRRAASASTSTRCAAGAPSAGAARCWSWRASSPSTASPRAARTCRRSPRPSRASRAAARCPPGTGCPAQAKIEGDLVIDVPPGSQVHRQVVRKAAEARAITLDPVVHLHYVEVREPDMHDPSGDLQRLLEALEREWQLRPRSRATCRCCRACRRSLRKGEWKVTVAVHGGAQHRSACGRDFTTASTGWRSTSARPPLPRTCAISRPARSSASAGIMNPQIRFGEDLMSRVSYSMMHPGGAQQMTEAVRGALNALAAEVAREAKVEATDILELTMVGNPIMHHLLLGIDPVELGGAPFALATDSPLSLKASELGLTLHPGRARLHPALHRRPRRRRCRRHDPRRAPGPVRQAHAAGGRRHQRRDRARQPAAPARLLEPDGACVRGRADQLRPARRARCHRARAH